MLLAGLCARHALASNRASLAANHLLASTLLSSRLAPVRRSPLTPAAAAASEGRAPSATGLPPALEGLQPEALWRHFGELSKIPRPSKHEERVLEWLKKFAADRGLDWQQVGLAAWLLRLPALSCADCMFLPLCRTCTIPITVAGQGGQHRDPPPG